MVSSMKKQLTVVVIAAFLFQIVGPVSNAEADWVDKSDELPGTISTTTIVLIGVGTLAAIGLIYFATKSSKKVKEKKLQEEKEKEKEKKDEESSGYNDNLNNREFSDSFQNSFAAKKRVSLVPYVGLKTTSSLEPTFGKENFDFSNQAVVVGLAVNF